MKAYETGTWDAFEAWLRTTLGRNFGGKIRPADTAEPPDDGRLGQ